MVSGGWRGPLSFESTGANIMKTRLSTVVFAVVVAGCVPAAAIAQSLPYISLNPGAYLVPGQPTPLSSLITVTRGTDPAYVGADITMARSLDVSIGGAVYSGDPFDYYYAKLFGNIGGGICCGSGSNAPPYTSVTITADAPTAFDGDVVDISGYVGGYYYVYDAYRGGDVL